MLASAPQLSRWLLMAWAESNAILLGKPSDSSTWRAWLTSADRSTLVVVGIAVLLVTCVGFWLPSDAAEAQSPESES